jgi:hypothetical protein
MKHNESKLQIACVKWFKLQYPMYIIFSIPNGGRRTLTEAKILKAEGTLAGVADLFLMYGNKDFNGLFIEMKFNTGKQTDTQIAFERKCKIFNYKYELCYSFSDFQNLINNYINNK